MADDSLGARLEGERALRIGIPDHAVLSGFVIVCEWATFDGRRFLSSRDGNGDGGRLTEWQRDGLLYNRLHRGGWEDLRDGE